MTKQTTAEENKRLKLRTHVSEAQRVLDGLFLELVPREREERLYYADRACRDLQLAIKRLETAKFEVGRIAQGFL